MTRPAKPEWGREGETWRHARRLAIARMSRSPWTDGWEDPAMDVYDDL
jgi:hypothetical protein